MKVRSDFVTNSSSSSFIVAFDKQPETREDVSRVVWACGDAIDIVFNDIQRQEPNNIDAMISEIQLGNIDNESYPDYDDYKTNSGDWDIDWDRYNKDCAKFAELFIKKHLEKTKGKFNYIFEYADDTELGSRMEHGDIFAGLEYIRISKH